MRWILALFISLVITTHSIAAPPKTKDADYIEWRRQIASHLASVNSDPQMQQVKTLDSQMLFIYFSVNAKGKMNSLEVKGGKNATKQSRIVLEKIFTSKQLPPPPRSFRSQKLVLPVVIEPKLSREELIKLLKDRSRAMSNLAKRLEQTR